MYHFERFFFLKMSEKKIPGAGALSVASRDVTKLLCQGP
jgi:hypothetical protein